MTKNEAIKKATEEILELHRLLLLDEYLVEITLEVMATELDIIHTDRQMETLDRAFNKLDD